MPELQLTKWQLVRDGDVITTPHARLWPVRLPDGSAAMLKVSTETEERNGHRLLRWWDGDGAVRLLAHDHEAVLLERAQPGGSLRAMSIAGQDAQATALLCTAAERLHRPRSTVPEGLVPLQDWFQALLEPKVALSPLLEQCRSLASALLATQIEVRPLHGDLHHDNVLDGGGARGWLAIDPKRLLGDRAFDYTVLFCNPDLCGPDIHVATQPAIFDRRVDQVSALAGLERTRLLRWIAASAGLSAVWFLEDGCNADVDLAVAPMALRQLARTGG
ncbi:APH(6)-I family aminoglycoside O-phosphotransferase [Stenotrophomonas rhizophila]|uniref:APH(6)-I family aminoglycoside O-phosphotransferase n=1 Tax=Stenotrophomonas rhizophila TaxID=216778 RepID=UPI00112F6AAB|nr:APH(6)-I family aminoglycoside O-phosphotransferase [Stenotrophomonas rhizophila]